MSNEHEETQNILFSLIDGNTRIMETFSAAQNAINWVIAKRATRAEEHVAYALLQQLENRLELLMRNYYYTYNDSDNSGSKRICLLLRNRQNERTLNDLAIEWIAGKLDFNVDGYNKFKESLPGNIK